MQREHKLVAILINHPRFTMQDDQIFEYASFSELDELDKLLNFYTTGQTPLNLSLKEPPVVFVA